jgi:hypothetical protein
MHLRVIVTYVGYDSFKKRIRDLFFWYWPCEISTIFQAWQSEPFHLSADIESPNLRRSNMKGMRLGNDVTFVSSYAAGNRIMHLLMHLLICPTARGYPCTSCRSFDLSNLDSADVHPPATLTRTIPSARTLFSVTLAIAPQARRDTTRESGWAVSRTATPA